MRPTLYIDSGSSLVKWGLSAGGERWARKGSCAEGEFRAKAPQAGAAVVADVAGAARLSALREAMPGTRVVALRAGREALGVRNLYERPGSLGIDRWCAAVAAYRTQGACIVVTAGTAVTLNWVDGRGDFRGGAILPGAALMRGGLAGSTRLKVARATLPGKVPALRTSDAVSGGIRLAIAGAVREFERECGLSPGEIPVLACGGDAAAVAGWLPGAQARPDLVLEGMRMLHPPRDAAPAPAAE